MTPLDETRAHRPDADCARFRRGGGTTGRLQTFEEGKQGVGRSVAAGMAGGRCDPVEGALFEREVGVQVDVGGALLLVTED